MGEELLRLKNIRKSFNSVTVLEDINITLSKGEVIALVGENGAGKSTLSNIISGVLKPDGGQIFFEGKEYKELTIKQAKDLGIKMVHQELLVLPKLNVTANIFIGSEYQNHGWMDVPKMHEKASELLNAVGLSVSPKTRVAEIDIAGRQMIEIARAIATNAKIIILDEPTSSLSDVEIKKLFETVNRLKKQGISFIFVSHRLQEVLTLSDRIYILKDGRLAKELYPENTTEDEIVMNMVGRSYDDYYKRKRVYFGKEVLRIENYSGIDNKVLARNAHTPRNISLQLNEGEVLGIAGLVGAGRTELLRLIFGEDKKESGECFLYGERVNIRRCKDAYDLGMAWVTEDRKKEGLIQKFDLKTNIALPIQSLVRKGLFVDVTKENAIADEFIENLHVKTTGRSQQARFLSGGNQQKVVLAKWLASNPRILVLDEPTRGIDVSAKAEIYALINNLTAQGMAILLVSSELPEIMGISDRIIVMHDGEITGEFQREEFSEQSIMTCAIGRRKE